MINPVRTPARLILTHGGALSNLPLFLALDAGLLAARGVRVEAPGLDGFGATTRRLRDRTAAVGTTGFTQPLADVDSPDPLVIVAGSGLRGMAVIGRPGSTLATVSGTVVTFADDPMEVLLLDVLEHYDLTERVTVWPMTSLAAATEALRSGEVEAITMVEPWSAMLLADGFSLLSDGTDVWGPVYPDTVLVTRRSFLEREPDAVAAVIAAMREAEHWIGQDPDGALAAVADRFPLFSRAQLRAGLARQPPGIDLRGIEDAILGRWSSVRRLAGLPPAPMPSDLMDLRCLAAVIAAESPSSPSKSPLSPSKRYAHVH